MEETEKAVALKKAYAEIILNTGKEAAARIMASEIKANRLRHDLVSTKDEAVRLLIGLKQMLDLKTNEAHNASLIQQKRIEELDAQLNEAEEMIVDLRAELRKAQDKLEDKKSHAQQSNRSSAHENDVSCENAMVEKLPDVSNWHSSVSHCETCLHLEKPTSNCDSFIADNTNIASIIMASKEPEFYRNGRTQRIRALERNLLDGKIASDQYLQMKVDGSEENLQTCSISSNKVENTDIMFLDGSEASPDRSQPAKVRKLPRSSISYVRSKTRFHKLEKLKKDLSRQKETSLDDNDQSLCPLRRSLRKRKVQGWDGSVPALSHCKKYSGNDGAASDEHMFTSKLGVEMEKVKGPASTSRDVTENTSSIMTEKMLLEDSSFIDAELSESTDGGADHTDNNRLLRYTFSRRHKKELMTESDECLALRTRSMSRKMGEKRGFSADLQKTGMIIDPSPETEGLVEVASQLISLSGKQNL